MEGPSEQDLLARAGAGDREALATIVSAHQGALRRYLARVAPDPVTADDLAQETFLSAFRSIERVDPKIGLRPYLFGTARNLARLCWRERLRGKEVAGEAVFAALAARTPEPETGDPSERRLLLLQDCLRQLAPKALDVVSRHYRAEERCDEIAGRLRMSAGNVRSILTRARQALRECIEFKLKGSTS